MVLLSTCEESTERPLYFESGYETTGQRRLAVANLKKHTNRETLMEAELRNLDNTALKALYDRELQALSQALLNGAEWKDVQDKRTLLIELSKLMDRTGTTNPAEHSNRT